MSILFSELSNHQSRHEATNKIGCQHGDCKMKMSTLFNLPRRFVWVCMGYYTHSIPLEGVL